MSGRDLFRRVDPFFYLKGKGGGDIFPPMAKFLKGKKRGKITFLPCLQWCLKN